MTARYAPAAGGAVERLGVGPDGRARFLLVVDDPTQVPADLGLDAPRFACLVAWDARDVPVAVVGALAVRLIRAGCVVACCWGPDCERVHDVFDEEDLAMHDFEAFEVVTTWHADEPLDEAVAFLRDAAAPFPAFEATCRAVVAVVIGGDGWAEVVRAGLRVTPPTATPTGPPGGAPRRP